MSHYKDLYDPYWYETDTGGEPTDPKEMDSCCKHEYVNVSFSHIILACKFCGLDKPQDKKEDKEWTD